MLFAKKFFVLLCLFSSLWAGAQYPKLIVQFTNKSGNTLSTADPSQYLSAKALLRRQRQNLKTDSTDWPVNQNYIDSLNLAGNVVVLSTSKWLNQVLIQSTDAAALAKIRKFSFVKKIDGVGYRAANAHTDHPKNLEEEFTPIKTSANRPASDVVNYGSSATQVRIHQGEFLHNKGYLGKGLLVAVLDAGFFKFRSNTAFDSLRLNNRILAEKDFVAFDNSVDEDDQHGANCLSIMAANWPGKMVGTAPNASYLLIRTENGASEYLIEEHNWAVGAEFADSSGADMISSSLGYTQFDDPVFNHTYSQFYKNATMVTQAATLAAKKGIIIMSSAGNDGNSTWKYQNFPADADSVCAVGAINTAGQIASFSSYGYPGKVKPNIVSVGVATVIASPGGQTIAGNGTSYSCPNVAGLVACLWQAFPSFSNMQILDAVYKSADRYTVPTDRFGFGIPNFKTAYRILKQQVNLATFGVNWLVATPNPFTNEVHGTFVGQVDGNARIEFLNPQGQVAFTLPMFTEKEEVYTYSFPNLDALPGGNYMVRYADSINSRMVTVTKEITATSDWLRVAPGTLFSDNLNVYIVAPENAQAAIRLLDGKGSKVAERTINASIGQPFQFTFNTQGLAKGIYYLQYISATNKRVVRLLKL